MHQAPLFFEDVNEAIKALVQFLGGPKKVGQLLRPELTLDGASTWLRDCMNPDRREKLSPEQLILLMRHGEAAGCHVLMSFVADSSGYEAPKPLDPADEMAELQKQFVASVEAQKTLLARMERLPDLVRPVVKMGAA